MGHVVRGGWLLLGLLACVLAADLSVSKAIAEGGSEDAAIAEALLAERAAKAKMGQRGQIAPSLRSTSPSRPASATPGTADVPETASRFETSREPMSEREWERYKKTTLTQFEGMTHAQLNEWLPGYGDAAFAGVRNGIAAGTSVAGFATGDDAKITASAGKAADLNVNFDRDANVSVGVSREIIPRHDGTVHLEYERDERAADDEVKLRFRAKLN